VHAAKLEAERLEEEHRAAEEAAEREEGKRRDALAREAADFASYERIRARLAAERKGDPASGAEGAP
jgi:hypothetical protein